LKDLHYPSDPRNAAEVAAAVPDAVHRLDVIRYGQDHWDATRIEAEINQVAEWARQNGVPVVCNEFGVYRKAQPQDRNAWIRDTRISLEHHAIGWAMWDYAENFGVAIKKDGKVTLDPDTMSALGLNVR
jgi:endoglucanase